MKSLSVHFFKTVTRRHSLNDIQYPTDVFEMTGWIPLDNIVFIDLSDNKRTKELNWNFSLAIRKQIKKKNREHEKLDEIHLTNGQCKIRHLEISSRPKFCSR